MSVAAEISWTLPDPKRELDPLIDNAPFAMARCQRQGNIIACNTLLDEMLGGPAHAASQLRFADLVRPQDRAEAERLLNELFERRRNSFHLDSQTAGPNSRPVRWTAWRIPDAKGNPDSALVLAEDSVRNHEAEKRLRQAERLEAMGRLAGGVAHDFNNLLTGVLLYCDLLLANLEPCHRVRKYAEEIRKAGIQATGLVRQLLSASGPTKCEPRLFSLNDIAEGMRNLLARLIGENIELKFKLDPNLGLIKMDPTQCQQILLNLVLNARDAMPAGGLITVETSNCKVQVLGHSGHGANGVVSLPCALFVVVVDNGSGMDAATRAHLFEAFFTTKAVKGTGLGLATVYDIVTGSGGLIHVDSAPACGTRVSVLLPLVPAAVSSSQDDPEFRFETDPGVLIPKAQKEEE
jgi:two-component system, cell cycle sensor histidine kinase and response regulator CckA